MDKYPIIIYLSASVLGKVAVELMFTDPVVAEAVRISHAMLYILEALGAVLVVVIGRLYLSIQRRRVSRGSLV